MIQLDDKEKQAEEKRFLNKRMIICVIIALVIFCGFACKLFVWQIVEGESYSKLALSSTAYTVTTDATRGEILDRDGKGLAVNRTGYRIVLDKLYIDRKKLDNTILSLIRLMNSRNEKWIDILPIKLSESGKFEFKKGAKSEIKMLKSKDFLNVKDSESAESCMQLLIKRYDIETPYARKTIRNLVSVHYNMERTWYSNTNPYVFANGISSDMLAIVSENMQSVSGVEIQTYLTRHNPQGKLAPHILGALGSITKEEYDKKQEEGKGYGLNDSIGKFGLELAYEDQLKGVGGERIVQKNADGNVTKVVESVNAKPGNTLYLTLDSKLQKTANKALEREINAARAYGGSNGDGHDCYTGAAVMLDVKDFSVLAASSYPTFNLNKYSKYSDYYVNLFDEKKHSPVYNRAFIGSFAPGSVFKPCVAAAALQENIISEGTFITCNHIYDHYPTNPVKCMGTHGSIGLRTALSKSCNVYFAETGRRLGIDTMYLYAEKFGLGEKTGLEVDESNGTLAGRDSKTWQEGNTVQAAIGQSDNLFDTEITLTVPHGALPEDLEIKWTNEKCASSVLFTPYDPEYIPLAPQKPYTESESTFADVQIDSDTTGDIIPAAFRSRLDAGEVQVSYVETIDGEYICGSWVTDPSYDCAWEYFTEPEDTDVAAIRDLLADNKDVVAVYYKRNVTDKMIYISDASLIDGELSLEFDGRYQENDGSDHAYYRVLISAPDGTLPAVETLQTEFSLCSEPAEYFA